MTNRRKGLGRGGERGERGERERESESEGEGRKECEREREWTFERERERKRESEGERKEGHIYRYVNGQSDVHQGKTSLLGRGNKRIPFEVELREREGT